MFFLPNTGPLIVHEYNKEEKGKKQTNNKVGSKTAANSDAHVSLIFSVLAARVSLGLCAAWANHEREVYSGKPNEKARKKKN